MRTLFTQEPFGKFEIGTVPGHACPHCGGIHQLGQEMAFPIEDYLQRIEGIADEKTRKELKAKYDECQAQEDDTKKFACFGSLLAQITSALRSEGKPAEGAPVGPTQPRPQPESAFPILPVAIGGLAVAGLVAYLATRK